jgi:hypothetical protein
MNGPAGRAFVLETPIGHYSTTERLLLEQTGHKRLPWLQTGETDESQERDESFYYSSSSWRIATSSKNGGDSFFSWRHTDGQADGSLAFDPSINIHRYLISSI